MNTRATILFLILSVLGLSVLLPARGCNPTHAETFVLGDTVKVCFSISDTFGNGFDPVGDSLQAHLWRGAALPVFKGTFAKAGSVRPGAECYYWIPTKEGRYLALWSGTVQGREPVEVYNFTVGPEGARQDSLSLVSEIGRNIDTKLGSPTTTIAGDIGEAKTSTDNARRAVWTGNGNVVADAANTAWMFKTDLDFGVGSDDYLNGQFLTFWSGTYTGLVRRISDYDGTTRVVTLRDSLPGVPGDSDDITVCKDVDVASEVLGLDGIRALDIRATYSDTVAVADAQVYLRALSSSTVLWSGTTGLDGYCHTWRPAPADSDTLRLYIAASGITWQTPESLIVGLGDVDSTFDGTAFDPGTPLYAGMERIYDWWKLPTGHGRMEPRGGVTVRCRLQKGVNTYVDVWTLSRHAYEAVTDTSGYWYIDVTPNDSIGPSGTQYLFEILDSPGEKKEVEVHLSPDSKTQFKDL